MRLFSSMNTNVLVDLVPRGRCPCLYGPVILSSTDFASVATLLVKDLCLLGQSTFREVDPLLNQIGECVVCE